MWGRREQLKEPDVFNAPRTLSVTEPVWAALGRLSLLFYPSPGSIVRVGFRQRPLTLPKSLLYLIG